MRWFYHGLRRRAFHIQSERLRTYLGPARAVRALNTCPQDCSARGECLLGRRVVAARRQDGRERQGGRGRVERRREEDEMSHRRHRCQSRPRRGRVLFLAN